MSQASATLMGAQMLSMLSGSHFSLNEAGVSLCLILLCVRACFVSKWRMMQKCSVARSWCFRILEYSSPEWSYIPRSAWSCRVARVCEELRAVVGVSHGGLADLWKERPRGPLWGSEEGPVLQAEGNGPVSGFEGLWGPAALCRGPERRELQAFGTAKARVRPIYSRNASKHRQTDHNSRCCFKEEDNVWNSRWIHAKMINQDDKLSVAPLFPPLVALADPAPFPPFKWKI